MNTPDHESERSCALSVGIVCAIIAFHLRARLPQTRLWAVFVALALSCFLLGLFSPSLLAGPARIWKRVTQAIGWAMTRLILAVMFWAVITPYGLIRRLAGHDSLHMKRATPDSRWTPYPSRTTNHYERMF